MICRQQTGSNKADSNKAVIKNLHLANQYDVIQM